MSNIKTSIFTAVIGATTGAVLSDDTASGAIRGAALGAAAGFGASKAISSYTNLKGKYGFKSMPKDLELASLKEIGGSFGEAISKRTGDPIKDDAMFLEVGDRLKNSSILKSAEEFSNSRVKAFKDISDNGTRGERYGLIGGTITEGLFNSMKSHLIGPTKSTVTKLANGQFNKISLGEAAATAFTGYGAYETVGIARDASNGNYGSAATGFVGLAISKGAYTGASQLAHMGKAAYDRGLRWGHVKALGSEMNKAIKDGGGYGTLFKNGATSIAGGLKSTKNWADTGKI